MPTPAASAPTALVTGATAGIGYAVANALAARGHDLVLVARDRDRLDAVSAALAERYGVTCEVLRADLADPDQRLAVEHRLSEPAAPIEVLVNNAGFSLGRSFLRTAIEDEERMLAVLVHAVLRLSRVAAGAMVARGSGVIVNISSVAGFVPYGTYGAAKAWVTSFTQSLAAELSGSGARAVAVCPGFVRTEFHDRAGLRMGGLPGPAWVSLEEVVTAVVGAIERPGPAVVVPTRRYRVIAALGRHAPFRLIGLAARRTGGFRPGRPSDEPTD